MSARKKAMRNKAKAAPKTVKTLVARKTKSEPAKKARTTAKAVQDQVAAAMLPNKAIGQKQSKSQIYAEISDIAGVSKSEARGIMAAIRNLIERHVKPKGSGEIVIPDLGIKVRRVQKKATKAKVGRNPFTGEEIQIAAKPARKSVKVSALKALKALIEE